MTRIWRSTHGVTLIEATIVLTAVAVLTAAAAPSTARVLGRARITRAIEDEEAVKTAITNFLTDASGSQGFDGFTIDGTTSGTPVDILVSDGDIPTVGTGGGAEWDDPVNNTTGLVDFLERHLVTNTPRGSAANDYPTTAGVNVGAWKGAYLNAPINPDPWGNRYAVNTQRLITTPRDVDVIVLSAGPDEEIDTEYNINKITPGDDDIVVIVRRDPGRTVP